MNTVHFQFFKVTGVQINKLSQHPLRNVQEAMKWTSMGEKNRTKAETAANAVSSRSHAILQIKITTNGKNAILSLIDLAGSERASVTQNKGTRLVEGSKINRSLLSLGNCITALCTQQKYIPFRDSKLTRLLKFSLVRQCVVVMVTHK